MRSEPDERSLNAPPDLTNIMRKSVFWNSEGHLFGADRVVVFQYIGFLIFIWFVLIMVLYTFIAGSLKGILLFLMMVFSGGVMLSLSMWLVYKWGWKNYQEKWYYFDEQNELFIVIFHSKYGWESIEIPYEEIIDIEYVQGNNGKAIIITNRFEFETNRARDKRASSVTELWDKLARIDVKMSNWPVQLKCQSCNRVFGHHIGTAICPFCKIILNEIGVKGRIDPINQHKDDLDRL